MLVTRTEAGTLVVRSGDDAVELNTDEALALFGHLSGHLPMMPAPEITRDGEHWKCPHCTVVLGYDEGDVIEYDSHQGESSAEFDGDNLYVSQVDTERATMAWMCGHCRRVVTVPGEIEVTW
jgi:hypothetical protein